MKLHYEEEDLIGREECNALFGNLEGIAKNSYQRDTAEKFLLRILMTSSNDALREKKSNSKMKT